MKKLIWILIPVLIISWSCEKEKVACCTGTDAFSEFIFGTYYGECFGEGCIETFKMEEGKLFEDQKDSYAGPFPYPGEWVELSEEKFQLVEDLPTLFPSELYDEPKPTIGMPDAGDWGGIYLEVVDQKGNRNYWNIDTMKDNLPQYLHAFSERVMEAVGEINQ